MLKDRSNYIRIGIGIFLLGIYLLLLPPYLIHNSQDRVGVVIQSEAVDINVLPEPVKFRLNNQSTWTLAIMQHALPDRIDAVITRQTVPVGSIIEVSKPTVTWMTDWHDFEFNHEFNRLVVSDSVILRTSNSSCPRQVSLTSLWSVFGGLHAFEDCLEKGLAKSEERTYVNLSRIDYLVGPLLITAGILIVNKRLSLWSLVTTLWIYTIQLLLSNQLIMMHFTSPDPLLLILGYLAFPLPIVIYLVRKWENSPSGSRFIEKAFGGF